MIANVWPEESHLEETISTLRFAQRMMKVKNELSVNVQLDPDILLKKYERQIKDLKLELAMHDTLVGRGRISYEAYSREQQYEQQQIAERFLKGELDDIDISSIRQVKELFIQFRNLYRNVVRQVEDSDKPGSPLKPAAKVVPVSPSSVTIRKARQWTLKRRAVWESKRSALASVWARLRESLNQLSRWTRALWVKRRSYWSRRTATEWRQLIRGRVGITQRPYWQGGRDCRLLRLTKPRQERIV